MGSFQTALSALKAASTAISTVGNNLANTNTAGFKRSSVSFSELVSAAASTPGQQVGGGVGVPGMTRQFTQGTVTGTGRALDAAVQGNGFFVVKPGTDISANSLEYTRDGHFRLSADGVLITNNNARVQGWNASPSTGEINAAGVAEDIRVPLGSVIPPIPTSTLDIAANFDASAADETEFTIPLQLFDSLGGGHQFTLKATKAGANSWSLSLSSTDPTVENGEDLTDNLSVSELSFVNGQLDPTTDLELTISSISFTGESGIPAMGDLTWSLWKTPPSGDPPAGGLSALTQFTQPSAITRLSQNGSPAGSLSAVRIEDGGKLVATYTNGLEREIAQVALAVVQNPDSLLDVGGNMFRASALTAVLPPSDPEAGGGKIVGQSIESSNVDIAQEFTDLITYQRSYQANSRVITTMDQLMFETLNLKQ